MHPRGLILEAARHLEACGVEDARTDASLLLAALTGRPALSLRLDTDTEPDDALVRAFEALTERRCAREPLQYLLGGQPFCGRTFRVTPAVLIPRPETELLCERAVERLRGCGAPAVLDLCCGSGCIAVTVALELPGCRAEGCDLSAEALAVARENAEALGAGVVWRQGDLFAAVPGRRYDAVLSNPPYIPEGETLQEEVRREPAMALFAGADGLAFYRRIVREAPEHLCPGGFLMMELGAGQAEAVRGMLRGAGFRDIRVSRDLNGLERIIEGTRGE